MSPLTIAIVAFLGGFLIASLPIVQTAIRRIFSTSPPPSSPLADEQEVAPADEPEVALADEPEIEPISYRTSQMDRRPDRAMTPRDIPVESLGDGVVNALGKGLGSGIESTVSTASSVASGVKDGINITVSGTKARLNSFYKFLNS